MVVQYSIVGLPRRDAGCVAVLQQSAVPAASLRKTKATQTLSVVYSKPENSLWTVLHFGLKQVLSLLLLSVPAAVFK